MAMQHMRTGEKEEVKCPPILVCLHVLAAVLLVYAMELMHRREAEMHWRIHMMAIWDQARMQAELAVKNGDPMQNRIHF